MFRFMKPVVELVIEKLGFKTKPADIVFHKDIFIPEELLDYLDGQMIQVHPSKHVVRDKINREYEKTGIYIPESYFYRTLPIARDSIVEVGLTWSGDIKHLLLRYPYDETWDIVFAVAYDDGTIKTFWFNARTDTHKTLDKSQYAQPHEWSRIKGRLSLRV